MTSSPESLFGLGIRGFQLHRNEQGGVGSKTEVGEVFSVKMESNCFLEIGKGLVQSFALRYDAYFQTFGNVVFLSSADEGFDCALELRHGGFVIVRNDFQ